MEEWPKLSCLMNRHKEYASQSVDIFQSVALADRLTAPKCRCHNCKSTARAVKKCMSKIIMSIETEATPPAPENSISYRYWIYP